MLLKTIGFNGSHRLKWSKNSNGLRWHNLRFPRCSSNRFRSSSHSTYNPPFTTRSMRSERVQMIWAQLLAYVTGTVAQELLLRNEYLAAENRILKAQIKGRLLLS